MERNRLFLLSSLVIVLSVAVVSLLSVALGQQARISGLFTAVSDYSLRLADYEGRSTVLCGEGYFKSNKGREYLKVSANADDDGVVEFTIKNLHNAHLHFVNVREIGIRYEGEDFSVYYRSPILESAEGEGSCKATLLPGQEITCLSSHYAEKVAETRNNGDSAFIIDYMKADVDASPRVVMAEDVCVRIS
jgi:hypothetical protein